jgi:hypothetical protein
VVVRGELMVAPQVGSPKLGGKGHLVYVSRCGFDKNEQGRWQSLPTAPQGWVDDGELGR